MSLSGDVVTTPLGVLAEGAMSLLLVLEAPLRKGLDLRLFRRGVPEGVLPRGVPVTGWRTQVAPFNSN